MIIFKGERHIIRAKGSKALKESPEGMLEMAYFPERDVEAIAGELDEAGAWQLLRDVADQAQNSSVPICPSHILIDGNNFRLAEWSRGYEMAYLSPQGYSASWALGATVFFVFMDCPLFGGEGGKVQRASTPVPSMRKGLEELNEVVSRCLAYNPEERPSLAEIRATAIKNMERLKKEKPAERVLKRKGGEGRTPLEESWPEEME